MDSKKQIKDFITYMCTWIEAEYKNNGHDGFGYNFRNDKLAYLIADKGIERRIEKQLFKKLGLQSIVRYIVEPSLNYNLDGYLSVQLVKKYSPEEWYKNNILYKKVKK